MCIWHKFVHPSELHAREWCIPASSRVLSYDENYRWSITWVAIERQRVQTFKIHTKQITHVRFHVARFSPGGQFPHCPKPNLRRESVPPTLTPFGVWCTNLSLRALPVDREFPSDWAAKGYFIRLSQERSIQSHGSKQITVVAHPER